MAHFMCQQQNKIVGLADPNVRVHRCMKGTLTLEQRSPGAYVNYSSLAGAWQTKYR